MKNYENVFIIGGERLYKEALNHQGCRKLYITEIDKEYDCDRFFPQVDCNKYKAQPFPLETFEKDVRLKFLIYNRISESHPEQQYLNKIREIMQNGNLRPDRTGVGTKSLFGCQMRYNINEYFPLLTTKRVFFRGILAELLWFLRGDTDAKILQKQNVRIWDGNTSREFLDKHNLNHYEEGDIGAGYSFQFRHAGAEYKGCQADYTGQGIDQVQECLRLIREDPTSRRILINLWSVADLKKMVLPPCHMVYQFYVYDGKLSCSMYQRSGDMGLGVPFNIASASLMTYIFAKLTNLEPGELIHTIGDAHIYMNHLEGLEKQLKREPRQLPKLEINASKEYKEVEDFQVEDFKVKYYWPYPTIKMEMAV